jgi:predicted CopG family antitoxin
MTTKNISITDEAYEALRREKRRKEESFTETILRLTGSRGKLSDSFGSWKLTDEEEATIRRELSKGWKLARERMVDEMSRY